MMIMIIMRPMGGKKQLATLLLPKNIIFTAISGRDRFTLIHSGVRRCGISIPTGTRTITITGTAVSMIPGYGACTATGVTGTVPTGHIIIPTGPTGMDTIHLNLSGGVISAAGNSRISVIWEQIPRLLQPRKGDGWPRKAMPSRPDQAQEYEEILLQAERRDCG